MSACSALEVAIGVGVLAVLIVSIALAVVLLGSLLTGRIQ